MIRFLIQKWLLLKEKITMWLFGLSGALASGSIYHVVQTCQGGNCLQCGGCAAAIAAAAASSSAGIAARTKGRRRWLLVGCIALAGLLIYGFLEGIKQGLVIVSF